MKLAELFKRVEFLGSSIEDISVDSNRHEVRMNIELCNWKKMGYTEEQPEMLDGILTLIDAEFMTANSFVASKFGYEILKIDVTEDGDFETVKIAALGESDVTIFEVRCKGATWIVE